MYLLARTTMCNRVPNSAPPAWRCGVLARQDMLFQRPRNTTAGIKRVLALPLAAQDKLLPLRKSLQMNMLHWSRLARKSDIIGAITKVEQEILAGILHVGTCRPGSVATATVEARAYCGELQTGGGCC